MAIAPDGRGVDFGTVDLRAAKEVQTVNMGRVRVHRRKVKTQLREELERLLATLQGWPPGEVEKFVRLRE